MSKYLITGGAGFIGSHIVDRLVQLGEDTRVLDDFSSGKLENIANRLDRVDVVRARVQDLDAARHAVKGCDYVIHLAAMASVPQSVADPASCNESNVTGTLNVLIAAKEAGVKRVVYASSSAVYGDGPELPKTEDMRPQPMSPYALSKLTGEHYCELFATLYGLETVSLRYFNVFGPRQNPDSEYAAVIAKFMDVMAGGERPTIYGDGRQTRDFSYVENNVSATLSACTRPGVAGQTLNVATGTSISLIELVEALDDALGLDLQPKYAEARIGDIKHSAADVSKARRLLGFEASVSLREGLVELASWRRTVSQ